MAFPTIIEKYGSLSATGFAKETTFGTPVAATTFLPMASNTMEKDPGWFAPHLMQGVRDLQIYNLYGEAKFNGAVTGPIFPSNAMALTVASIGADNTVGNGVTGSTPTNTTTIAAPITAGTNTFTLTSATGYAVNDFLQVDVNGTTTTSEVRKILTLVGVSGTVDSVWSYNHLTAAAANEVVAPYIHTIVEQNTLPSLTVEKNLGGFQSLQFAGCRVNKWDLKAPVGNTAVEMTADLMGRAAAIVDPPTAINVVSESPFVFSEATLTIFGNLRAEASNINISIENGVKETYTYSNFTGPSFLTPLTLHVSGTLDVVFSSLNDATYGDFTKMSNGTLGALDFVLLHTLTGEKIEVQMPQIVLSKYANDLKIDDVVMSTLTYEASRPLTGSSLYTIKALITNNTYLPY